ncbi:hypothetical protein PG999_013722 [Apiospora kogelbergensis]|uniref:Uncharacterized protein n=1 Tax=Apiospora kogelbergensis TaxID=1337665 RepID=A0AAW0Q841_9PEZI
MPPKKHTRAESDANQASTSSDKRQKTNKSAETPPDSGDEAPQGAAPEKELFGWYCVARPRSDFENEAGGPGADEEEIEKLYLAQRDKKLLGEPAEKHPEHKWVAFWKTWTLFIGWSEAADFCDSDAFGMHIYTDFHGWGLQEIVERMFVAFDVQFKKKQRDEETINHMWAVVAAAVHWLAGEDLSLWFGADDADRISQTVKGIGSMLLSMLNELDRAGELKADSRMKDLALIMAWYLEWSKGLTDMLIQGDELDWRAQTVAYAKKAGIDLASSGLFGAGDLVSALEKEKEDDGGIPPLAAQAKADLWGWKKTFTALKKGYPKFGGRQFDITQFSKAERKRHSFDGQDPFAGIPEKEIKAGNIAFA